MEEPRGFSYLFQKLRENLAKIYPKEPACLNRRSQGLRTLAASTSETVGLREILASAAVPLVDLPEALTEKILGRLTYRDYIRFGAVCRGWREIKRDHPMPALNIPWFLPLRRRQESVVCSVGLHSSDEQRLRIPFSPTCPSQGAEDPSFSPLPYGWLLFDDRPLIPTAGCHHSYEFSLLNPITGVHIRLPTLRDLHFMFRATISPPPRCDVFVVTPAAGGGGNNIHMYRRGNPGWTRLSVNRHDWGVPRALASVIYYDGKFFCFRLGNGLMVVDMDCPTEDQIEPHYLEMDQSLLPNFSRQANFGSMLGALHEISFNQRIRWQDPMSDTFLVESNGKLLLVCHFYGSGLLSHNTSDLARFELFEADLSNMRWVKADDLGDHALLIYRNFAVSLVAADVGVEQNCIYMVESYMHKEKQEWNMFDLSTGEVADASLPFPPPPSTHFMFVPSIY